MLRCMYSTSRLATHRSIFGVALTWCDNGVLALAKAVFTKVRDWRLATKGCEEKHSHTTAQSRPGNYSVVYRNAKVDFRRGTHLAAKEPV